MPSHVAERAQRRSGRWRRGRPRRRATSGGPSCAVPPPGTTNAIDSASKTSSWSSVISLRRARATPSTRRPTGSATPRARPTRARSKKLEEPPADEACSAGELAEVRARPAGRAAESTTASSDEADRPPAASHGLLAHSGSASQTSRKRRRHQHERDQQDARPERPLVDDAARSRTTRRARRRASAQYGGSAAHQGPTGLKAFQKRVFAACSSSARVDVGHDERLDRRREALELAERRRRAACESGNASSLTNASASSPITTTQPRLHDAQLAPQPRAARLEVGAGELDAVRAEDLARVDVQPLAATRLSAWPGAAVEGDALLRAPGPAGRT